MGAEDDCVIAERLAQLCLAKYPSSLAIPPPTKFEKHNSSFNVQRTFSAPVFTDAEKSSKNKIEDSDVPFSSAAKEVLMRADSFSSSHSAKND